MGDRWTRQEDQLLLDGAGVFAVEWFQRKTERTRKSIYRRAFDLYGRGGLSRGTYSLERAADETGYSPSQLLRAQSALGQKWKRLSAPASYLITVEQLDDLIGWLQHDYWCSRLRLYGCVNCGSDKRPARGMGLCPKDYWQIRRLCTKLELPRSVCRLLELVVHLDSPAPEMRALGERLHKGWGPTIKQVKGLAAA